MFLHLTLMLSFVGKQILLIIENAQENSVSVMFEVVLFLLDAGMHWDGGIP